MLWGGDIRPFDQWGVLWTFDTDARVWTRHEKLTQPTSVYYGRLAGAPGDGPLLLYGGGPTGSDASWLDEAGQEPWRPISVEEGRSPGERSRFAMAAEPDGVLLFGGQLGPSQYEFESDTWWFDWAEERWSRR